MHWSHFCKVWVFMDPGPVPMPWLEGNDMDANLVQNSWLPVAVTTGLILMVLAFTAVVVWAFSGRQKKSFERAAALPLEDDASADLSEPNRREVQQ
jgi:cbb3-type cytochrome oxidase subunit 3